MGKKHNKKRKKHKNLSATSSKNKVLTFFERLFKSKNLVLYPFVATIQLLICIIAELGRDDILESLNSILVLRPFLGVFIMFAIVSIAIEAMKDNVGKWYKIFLKYSLKLIRIIFLVFGPIIMFVLVNPTKSTGWIWGITLYFMTIEWLLVQVITSIGESIVKKIKHINSKSKIIIWLAALSSLATIINVLITLINFMNGKN